MVPRSVQPHMKASKMTSAENINDYQANGTHQKISWLLLAGLLFLRFLVASIRFFNNSGWVLALVLPPFEVSTYFLTACLIWRERERLADFNINTLAIAIIILFKPIETIVWLFLALPQVSPAFTHPLSLTIWTIVMSLAIWIIAIGLLVALRRSHTRLPKIQTPSFRWFIIGAAVCVVNGLLSGYPMSFQIDKSELMAGKPELLLGLLMVVISFVNQVGAAAVTEEPAFRGFLWGHLRKMNWPEGWIWLFQAGVFWLVHIYHLRSAPFSFWIVVPKDALILGLLAWRSRSIVASIAAHAAGNALGYAIGCTIAYYRP